MLYFKHHVYKTSINYHGQETNKIHENLIPTGEINKYTLQYKLLLTTH